MQKRLWQPRRITAMLLVCISLMSLMGNLVYAIGDDNSIEKSGSTTVTITADRQIYPGLVDTDGSNFRASNMWYETDKGLTGKAFCMNWDKHFSGTQTLNITGVNNDPPELAGMVANGYANLSTEDFVRAKVGDYPGLAGLTEDEFKAASQIAVWIVQGNIGIEGADREEWQHGSGRNIASQPDEPTYWAIIGILKDAMYWTRVPQTHLEIRTEPDSNSESDLYITGEKKGSDAGGLQWFVDHNSNGIKKESISGQEYYTREFTVSSATSTFPMDYYFEL